MNKYGTAKQATDDSTCACTECQRTNVTDKHLEYLTFITFPWQQWLCACTSMLCLYIKCLSCYCPQSMCTGQLLSFHHKITASLIIIGPVMGISFKCIDINHLNNSLPNCA